MHLKRSRPMIIQYVPSHFAFIDLNKECSFNLARKAAIFIITRHKPLSTHHCVILRNLGQSTSHIFIECNAINLFWQISCSAQYESWLLFRNMYASKKVWVVWLWKMIASYVKLLSQLNMARANLNRVEIFMTNATTVP